jgi:hypothetical protein
MSSPRSRSIAIGCAVVIVGALLWRATRSQPLPAARTDADPSRDTSHSGSTHEHNAPRDQPGADAQRANNSDDASATTRAPQGQVIARASWGSGADQLGHDRPQEANAEAPMSQIVGPDGTIHVLDQVNRRIQRFSRDGRLLGSTPIGLLGAQDIALTRNGSYVVMDRLADRTIAIVGQDGREQGRLPITGEHVERTGNVTGLFVDGNDVLVEREHGPLVRVGDANGGDAQRREEVPGRPTRDGRAWMTAGITDQTEGRLYINVVARPSREHMYTRELRVAMETRALVMLDSDTRGVIYLGAVGTPRTTTGAQPIVPATDGATTAGNERVLLLCIDGATGRAIGQTTLPPNTSADETFREFTVPDEGGVIYAVRDERGVEYRRYDCRP